MRICRSFPVKEGSRFKSALLHWAQQYQEVVWLDSNEHLQQYSSFEAALAVDAFTAIKTSAAGAFEQLEEYQRTTVDWLFGYLSYDLKNDIEDLSSSNFDGLGFPDLYFFQPKKVFLLKGNEVELSYLRMVEDDMEQDLEEITTLCSSLVETPVPSGRIEMLKARITRGEYLTKVQEMLGRIHRGDIYEANFCQEFFAENAIIEPLQVYKNLNRISNPPFAAFVRLETHYLISASPERYLQKKGDQIISQPIKGTAARGKNEREDRELAAQLASDPKERSENIMIVDLVRNDLSRIAQKGSVEVTELCKVYSFQQVHQLVSTVKAKLDPEVPVVRAIRNSFPMGSMTGAPKISSMKIIEELEATRRGVYSGAIGYFTPDSDFDFNVVIRTILYNQSNQYLSFSVGGAITARSLPEKEYEECLVKAKALHRVLGSEENQVDQ